VYIQIAPKVPRNSWRINLVLRDSSCIPFKQIVWDMLNFHWLIFKCWHTNRVANLVGFFGEMLMLVGEYFFCWQCSVFSQVSGLFIGIFAVWVGNPDFTTLQNLSQLCQLSLNSWRKWDIHRYFLNVKILNVIWDYITIKTIR
jgi:hypothetical protein